MSCPVGSRRPTCRHTERYTRVRVWMWTYLYTTSADGCGVGGMARVPCFLLPRLVFLSLLLCLGSLFFQVVSLFLLSCVGGDLREPKPLLAVLIPPHPSQLRFLEGAQRLYVGLFLHCLSLAFLLAVGCVQVHGSGSLQRERERKGGEDGFSLA